MGEHGETEYAVPSTFSELALPVYLGVDPGKSGGVALVDSQRNAVAWKMPATERDLCDLFRVVEGQGPNLWGAIELVHSMPQQGVKSTFTFGVNYGGLRMALICNNIPFEEVRPAQWQSALGIPKAKKGAPKTEHKNVLKGKAQQLFPHLKVTLATADALLIAEWCRRQNSDTLPASPSAD